MPTYHRYLFFFFLFSSPGRVFLGWGGVGWDVDIHLHLLHELDATSRMGWGWGGGGMMTLLTFLALAHMFAAKDVSCTCTHT